MFGISSAPEKYQQIVSQVVSDCRGSLNIADDLIVHGINDAEHDANLFAVLSRLQERGLTLNLEKCYFRLPSIQFYGLQLSALGVEPTAEKVRAITDAPQPKTASELRSFLGTVGFNSRFIPDLSTTAEPLRAITQKGAEFRWGKQQEAAFKKLKQQLAAASSLAYFDTGAPTEVIADASPVGIGAILIQEQQGVRRAVCYASRTLTDVERRYS